MKSFSISLATDPGCKSVGDKVIIKLKSANLSSAVCENGLIEGVITSSAIIPTNGCYVKKIKAWDACKGAYVELDQQVYSYLYTLTIEYDDTTQVLPSGTQILNTWVESVTCVSATDSIILEMLGGPCGFTNPEDGDSGFLVNLTVNEDVNACGRELEFINNGTIFKSLNLPDRRRVTQTAHGYVGVGNLVALQAAGASTYSPAISTIIEDTAIHLAGGVDANNFDLLSPGFYIFADHGFTVGQDYYLSHSVPGGFCTLAEVPENCHVQYCFRAETADCLYLNLQPPSGYGTAPLVVQPFFQTSFTETDFLGVETCGENSGPYAEWANIKTVGNEPFFSDVSVGIDNGNCAFQSNTLPGSLVSGHLVRWGLPDKTVIKFSLDVAVSNLIDIPHAKVLELQAMDGIGIPNGVTCELTFKEERLTFAVYNDEVGPTILIIHELMKYPAIDKWHRIEGILRLNTPGTPNGSLQIKGTLLDGDMHSGSYGAELMTIFDKFFYNQEFRRDSNPINKIAVMGATDMNSGTDVVTILIDNLKVFDA